MPSFVHAVCGSCGMRWSRGAVVTTRAVVRPACRSTRGAPGMTIRQCLLRCPLRRVYWPKATRKDETFGAASAARPELPREEIREA